MRKLGRNYDNYEEVEYIVKGHQDYGLHIELVKNPIESTKNLIKNLVL